jgi:LemA protein
VVPGRRKDLIVTVTLIVIVAIVVLLLVVAALMYNALVRRRNQVDNAWSQIDVQLKRRYDLIPNLVETVKGYATHERGTLEAVTNARANAINAQGPAQQAGAENMLSGALKSLFAVAESYPDLKASQTFLQLQQELSETEDRAAYARQYYNDSVLSYNNAVTTLPQNIFAALFGFRTREYFQAGGEERGPVRVQF